MTEPFSCVSNAPRRSRDFLRLFAFVLGAFVILFPIGWFLYQAAHSAAEAKLRCECAGRLRTLVMAMHRYHHDFGEYPPAWTEDGAGNRRQSWRVLILPYLEPPPETVAPVDYQKLYAQIRLDEPWDSP